MHEPPRSDAAGLQTPDCYRADEGPDGGWRLTNKRTALVSRAQLGEWCKAEDVDATLAALRARTDGLQQELAEATRIGHEFRDALNDKLSEFTFSDDRERVTLGVDAETYHRWHRMIGEWRQSLGEIEAAEHRALLADVRAMKAEDALAALRASHETLQAERDAALSKLQEWKRRWFVEKERHGNA